MPRMSSAKSSWRARKARKAKIAGSPSDALPGGRSSLSSPKGKGGAGLSRRGVQRAGSGKNITRISVDELPKAGRTDWKKLDLLTDEDIAAAAAHDPDAAPTEIDWSSARIITPVRKKPLSIRLDPDVFAFFKSKGRGYQTRINAVLRHYVEHERKKKAQT
jgi:uncharacterized protein (DUF4415 family)